MAAILTGFVGSTIGFSIFLYGKKQARLPQLVAGMLLMVVPFLMLPALWTGVLSALVVAVLWGGVRAGW